VGQSDVGPWVTLVLGIVVVNLRGASGNTLYWVLLLFWCGASGNTFYWVLMLVYVPRATLYWVLLLVYVGPWATHFTGWVLLLVMLRLGQHILLAIVVSLWGALDNTPYWVLLLVMRGFGQHTLLGIIIGLMWGAFINGFKIILFLKTIVDKPCGDNGSLVWGGSEPRAAPYDIKQISVEESNWFCACHLLNCDEGKTDKKKKVNPAGYWTLRTLLGKVAMRSYIAQKDCTSIRWQSTI
jgi:hypothetical protein